MFGIAGAVPQNAAIQRVAPNAMRGQVTAIYLFMFTFFGAMGSFVVGLVQDYVIGDEAQLWKTLVLTASILLPVATCAWCAPSNPIARKSSGWKRREVDSLARAAHIVRKAYN